MNISRRFAARTLAASMAVAVLGCAGDGDEAGDDPRSHETTRVALRRALRAAWIDHATWTRMALVAGVAEGPDAAHAFARLRSSHEAIGALHARFAEDEDEVGGAITRVMNAGVVAQAEVLAAARRDDSAAAADARSAWEAAGQALADLLSTTHLQLAPTDTRQRIQRPIGRWITQVDARVAGDWEADAAAADRAQHDVLALADAMADAIADEHPSRVGPADPTRAAADALRAHLRAAWTDHATWTRLAVAAHLDGRGDAEVATGRLLRAEAAVGAALRRYHGDVADQLTARLEEHVVLGLAAITEAGAPPAIPGAGLVGATGRDRWALHADSIGDLLADANPAWDRPAMRGMMRVLVDRSFAGALARIDGDHAAGVLAHDALQRHVLAMADVLADGTVERFPDQLGG